MTKYQLQIDKNILKYLKVTKYHLKIDKYIL